MSPHNCFDFPTSFNIVHYVNHYLNLACCNIICIFLWAYCHNNISPVAPKLIKHSTSYIFLPLFSSLHNHYTILGRVCQPIYCKKTAKNPLTLGQICVIMALYTLKGMRMILIWVASGNYPPCDPSTFSQIRAFLGLYARQICGFKTPEAQIVWICVSHAKCPLINQ